MRCEAASAPVAPAPAVEPLSERELNVLRLLRTELSGPEIARELMVSLNTFRTHTKNIYSKLGVNNRRGAVRRAEELAFLQANTYHLQIKGPGRVSKHLPGLLFTSHHLESPITTSTTT